VPLSASNGGDWNLLTITSGCAINGVPSGDTAVTSFSQLSSDIAALTSGATATYYLDSAFTPAFTAESGARLAIPAGASVTLDLDGCDLSITQPEAGQAAIEVPSASSLTIEDSSTSTVADQGTLTATGGESGAGTYGSGAGAGIGGDGAYSDGGASGTILIAGGQVTATGGEGTAGVGANTGGSGAGIGGGGAGESGIEDGAYSDGGASGPITVSGGDVTAAGGTSPEGFGAGAGIGGGGGAGYGGASGTIQIAAGQVTATGGEIADGADAGSGAGIGGGGGSAWGGASGTIQIAAGHVTATGGSIDSESEGGTGAGIGGGGGNSKSGGLGGNSGQITVSGGDVTAVEGTTSRYEGGAGAGIGGGGGYGGTGGGSSGPVTVSGTPSLSGEVAGALTVQAAATLGVPAGQTLTLDNSGDQNDGTITLAGELTGSGKLANDGLINPSGSAWSIPGEGSGSGGLTITDGGDCTSASSVPSGAVPVISFGDLQDRVSSLASGAAATYYVEAAINSESSGAFTAASGQRLTIPAGASVTLDLDACDLSITHPGFGQAAIEVPSASSFTVEDTSTNATAEQGTLTVTGGVDGDGGGAGIGTDGDSGAASGTVTIAGGNVTATGGSNPASYGGGGGGAGIGGGGGGDGDGGAGSGPVSMTGGALTATGGNDHSEDGGGGAGIGGGGGGSVFLSPPGGPGGPSGIITLSGGSVTAAGGAGNGGGGAAGIGGGGGGGSTANALGGDSGMVTLSGAAVSVTGGSDLGGGAAAAGIGGGEDSNGVRQSPGPVEVSAGTGGGAVSSLAGEVAGPLTVDPGATLDVDAGSTLTLDDGADVNQGTISLAGVLAGPGTLDNDSSILEVGSAWSAGGIGPGDGPAGLTISGNSYALTFTPPSGQAAPSEIWVFAPSVAAAGLTLPDVPGAADDVWESASTVVTDSTPLSSLATTGAGVQTIPLTAETAPSGGPSGSGGSSGSSGGPSGSSGGSSGSSGGSSGSSAPTIRYVLSSSAPESADHWWRSPVTVSFVCTWGTGTTPGTCPPPVSLRANGADQTVSRTITGADGQTASVTVSAINIDQGKARVAIAGPVNGAWYFTRSPTPSCVASEALSGVASCKLTAKRVRTPYGYAETVTAAATTKAGVLSAVAARFDVQTKDVSGARPKTGTVYAIKSGRAWKLYVLSKTRPRSLPAVTPPTHPSRKGEPLRADGKVGKLKRWEMTVKLPAKRHNATVTIEIGKHLTVLMLPVPAAGSG
jgi:hypothetical protein